MRHSRSFQAISAQGVLTRACSAIAGAYSWRVRDEAELPGYREAPNRRGSRERATLQSSPPNAHSAAAPPLHLDASINF